MNSTTHSRGPGGLPRPAAGRARSANVSGPPSASNTGTSIEMSMWPTMWLAKSAIMYIPSPELVVTNRITQPDTQNAVRPTGHESPRRRSRQSPHRYKLSMITDASPSTRSNRHRPNTVSSENGPGSSKPSNASWRVGTYNGAGGGVRPSETDKPSVPAITADST